MSVSGIEAIGGFTPTVAPQLNGAETIRGSSKVDSSFGDLVVDGLDRLETVQDRSDKLAVQAASGDLDNIHDYTIAATEAAVTTQLTVAVRNKALEAFNEIMRMPIG
jgi:flagellar hook-basal body complex protein FliE